MALRSRNDSPGGLAAELAESKERWENKRADIMSRAATRQEHIRAMQAELDKEHNEHQQVLNSASV